METLRTVAGRAQRWHFSVLGHDTVAIWVGLLLGAFEFPEKLLDHH